MWQGFGSARAAGTATVGEGKIVYVQSYNFPLDALDDGSKFPTFS